MKSKYRFIKPKPQNSPVMNLRKFVDSSTFILCKSQSANITRQLSSANQIGICQKKKTTTPNEYPQKAPVHLAQTGN